MTHIRVWQFQPAPGREEEFAAAYSGDGVWAQLFRQADGFVGTALLAPVEPGEPWLTLDRWQSLNAFERFQESFGEAYRGLDAELMPLTADEVFIGAFNEFPA
jgi:heme-degrading monooxygenase HmoA